MAFFAAASAASWAANGVPLREPLKPTEPALDHARTLPIWSVMVTNVLLNVEWMCTTPSLTMRFCFFFLTVGFSVFSVVGAFAIVPSSPASALGRRLLLARDGAAR